MGDLSDPAPSSQKDAKEKTGKKQRALSRRMSRKEKERTRLLLQSLGEIQRPKTRGDCEQMPRPCPFVSCRYHLYLEVNPRNGTVSLNFPNQEVWELQESCVLDMAQRGPLLQEQIADLLSFTKGRISQLEEDALSKMKKLLGIDYL